jgi:hypothetical protein
VPSSSAVRRPAWRKKLPAKICINHRRIEKKVHLKMLVGMMMHQQSLFDHKGRPSLKDYSVLHTSSAQPAQK